MNEGKKHILGKIYLVYISTLLFAFVIIGKIIYIQFFEGEKWKKKAEDKTVKYVNIKANRGNIYADNGSLLATSIPIFEVRMDINSSFIDDDLFYNKIDSLAYCLTNLFKDRTQKEYYRILMKARKNGNRYLLLKNNVTYAQLKQMRRFPILRLGKYKGGMITVQRDKRRMPFEMLAKRTIGWDKEEKGNDVGLEGAFSEILQGISGKKLMQKIAGGIWMPMNDENLIEPRNGCDIITTIDVNIQDVTHSALKHQLQIHKADYGCAILMEVETGYIKAIVNLTKVNDSIYEERYNYAVGERLEPGSTFKLPSIMVALEDGIANIYDSINTGNGITKYYGVQMKDSHEGGYGRISIKNAFEVSSNIGISRVIYNAYYKDPQKFIDGLYRMGLNKPSGIEIKGEPIPFIKSTFDKSWSGTSLPWIAHGYEVEMTPLQILVFYNAVANNGKMVKPTLVREIKQAGRTIKSFDPIIVNKSICSRGTIEKAKELLEGVVENGTAKNLKNSIYKIAGKTGTALIANSKYNYTDDKYNASFVGYFPANNPKYSCIVVINNPSSGIYYGSTISAPVFKEIADKVYATRLNIHQEIKNESKNIITSNVRFGNEEDLKKIYNFLQLPFIVENPQQEKQLNFIKSKYVRCYEKDTKIYRVPNVRGMKAKDALYLLESIGLSVKISGKGIVKEQSIDYGSKVVRGSEIILHLSS